MKKQFITQWYFASLLLLASQLQAQKQSVEWSETYIRENVAFTSIKGRSVSVENFVYEIKVTDFNKSISMPVGFGLNGIVFSDDGLGNDLVKGDGVYTSREQVKATEGNARVLERSYSFHDESFKYTAAFRQAGESGGTEVSGPGIKCKFRKCGCPCRSGYTCRACEWWGWQCWEVYDCEISLF